MQCCIPDTLYSDVRRRSIAGSAAATDTPLTIQMTDIQVCDEDKIIYVVRQAPQHEDVWGKGCVS